MPLISLDGEFGGACSDVGTIPVVVYHDNQQDYGFMVSKIVDIIGLIDGIVPEPAEGAHADPDGAAEAPKKRGPVRIKKTDGDAQA